MIKELIEELESLTTDQIANLLIEKKITEIKGNTTCCPIANYLKYETGLPVRVSPSWYFHDYAYDAPLLNNPKSVTDFVLKFDQDQLPRELYAPDE